MIAMTLQPQLERPDYWKEVNDCLFQLLKFRLWFGMVLNCFKDILSVLMLLPPEADPDDPSSWREARYFMGQIN